MAETMVFLTPTFFLGYTAGDRTNLRVTPNPGYTVSLVIPPCDDLDCHCEGRGHVDIVIKPVEVAVEGKEPS